MFGRKFRHFTQAQRVCQKNPHHACGSYPTSSRPIGSLLAVRAEPADLAGNFNFCSGFSSNLFYQCLISRPNNKIHIREETSLPSDHSQPGTLVGWCYVCCDQHWDCPWNLRRSRKVTENIRVVFSWGGGIRMDWISLNCLWVQLV